MSKLFWVYAVVAGVIVAVLVLTTHTTYAQSAAQGIQLSPSIIELNAKPGGIYTLTVEAMNITPGDLNYKVTINDFTAKDESGVPKIIYDANLPKQISIRSWVSTISSFRLNSKATKKVEFKVIVPQNAEPGGHYGVFDFTGSDVKIKQTGVGLTASAGTLVLIKVAGDIKEQASIASFYAANGNKASNFFETAPVNLITRIQNTGNIHFRPFGTIEIKNMFGSLVATLPINKDQANVLPQSIRRFDSQYGNYMIGLYTATATIGYGTKGEALMASTTYWVVPYRLIGTGLIILAFIVFISRRLQKAYNRRVIKKYQNAQKNNNAKKDQQ